MEPQLYCVVCSRRRRDRYRIDERIYGGRACARRAEPVNGGFESRGDGDSAVSFAAWAARNLTMAAEGAGRADSVLMWAGQSVSLAQCTDVAAFLKSLVEEVGEIAGPVVEWSARRRRKSSSA